MSAVIEIDGLRKTYRSLRRRAPAALDGFDMVVEAGQVHGFLGPNGSGKTTTLRTLLGPDPRRRRPDARARHRGAGARCRRWPARSARSWRARSSSATSPPAARSRCWPTPAACRTSRVDEVLELVGLRDRADDRVKTYSLGMKQRLAVASALLKKPKLLILDEPANGLDPAGIREMRDLMRDLADAGMTVLLSSHILGEIQLICDSRHDHLARPPGRRRARSPRCSPRIPPARVPGPASASRDRGRRAAATAAGLPVARHAGPPDGHRRRRRPPGSPGSLAEQGVCVSELAPVAADLESVFLELTGTAPDPAVPRQVDGSTRPDDAMIDLDAPGVDA